MADESSKIKAYYREHFGFDPDKLSPEQAQKLSDLVTATENAMGRPVIAKPGGGVQVNPDFEYLKRVGIPRRTAQAMSLWQHYKAGIVPESLDRERLIKAGFTPETADQVAAERMAEFKGRAPSRYQMFERDDEPVPAAKPQQVMQMPAEEVRAAPPQQPEPQQQQQAPSAAAMQAPYLSGPTGPSLSS